jgi:hypothetical protein
MSDGDLEGGLRGSAWSRLEAEGMQEVEECERMVGFVCSSREDEVVPFVGEEQLNVSPTVFAARREEKRLRSIDRDRRQYYVLR